MRRTPRCGAHVRAAAARVHVRPLVWALIARWCAGATCPRPCPRAGGVATLAPVRAIVSGPCRGTDVDTVGTGRRYDDNENRGITFNTFDVVIVSCCYTRSLVWTEMLTVPFVSTN